MAPDIRVTLRPTSTDENLNRDLRVVCIEVISVCREIIGSAPALGWKPFVIQEAIDGLLVLV